MANDPNYNPLGQERYDIYARELTETQGLQGPAGSSPTLTGAVAILSGRYITTWAGSNLDIVSYSFAAGELNPATDMIAVQIWPTSETADQVNYTETVTLAWRAGGTTTDLYAMPANLVGGWCWYGYIAQFSDATKADVTYIDPGGTPVQVPRGGGATFSAVTLGQNWMGVGGSLVVRAKRITLPAPATIEFRTIVKIWKIIS